MRAGRPERRRPLQAGRPPFAQTSEAGSAPEMLVMDAEQGYETDGALSHHA
jgi:hypothetical protein